MLTDKNMVSPPIYALLSSTSNKIYTMTLIMLSGDFPSGRRGAFDDRTMSLMPVGPLA